MSNEDGAEDMGVARVFQTGGSSISAGRDGRGWTLRVGERVLRTRDLSGGVDELLGPKRANLGLVMRILEADANDAAQPLPGR